MKLLSKYNRVNIITLIVALVTSGVCFYFVIRFVLKDQLDHDLQIEKEEVIDFIAKNAALPKPSLYHDQEITFIPITDSVKENYSNVYMRLKEEDEKELIRQLEFSVTLNGKHYLFTVRKSQEETESLISVVVMSTFGIIILMLVLLFLINRLFFRKLWQPFNTALSEIKKFHLSNKASFTPQKTEIDEFNELNESVDAMTKTIIQDYTSLKNFTENMSHEIQTPLAIIRSKLEILMQHEDISEQQMSDLIHVAEASDRLSRLNRSLILLTRIDNRQFREIVPVDITALILKELSNYEELIDANKIKVVTNLLQQGITVSMNHTLAEALISNLMTNSIKHNITGGEIEVRLNSQSLVFENTGKKPMFDPGQLFERFKTGSEKENSLGLGLSIIKKICDLHNFKVNYEYADSHHRLTVEF